MQTIRIGLGRLYNADGFSLSGREELLLPFPLGSIEVEVYLGPKPRHLIGTITVGPRESQDANAGASNSREFVVPSPERFPTDFYTEFVAVRPIELNDAIAAAFHAQDKGARDQVFRKANEERPKLTRALDLVAGIVGLRLHYLLVRTPITEQVYAYRDNGGPYSFSMGLPVTVTESFELDVSDNDLDTIRTKIPRLTTGWTLERASKVLAWLLRAWSAEDAVLRFVSLFIPLECVIPNLPVGEKVDWDQKRKALIAVLQSQNPTTQVSVLLEFVTALSPPPPPLALRFAEWATRAALPGWKEDITAFNQFIKMRNLLVHAGKESVESRVIVNQNDVRTLEDITERYISLALFGDANVYVSRKRKNCNPALD